jgi:hypothetical protein
LKLITLLFPWLGSMIVCPFQKVATALGGVLTAENGNGNRCQRQWLQLQTAGNFISNRLCRWCCEYQLRAARVMRAMPRVKMRLGVGRV